MITGIIIIAILIIAFVVVFAYLAMPKLRWHDNMVPFEQTYTTYGGRFDLDNHIPQYSEKAISEAIQAKYGIVLPVRLSKDSIPVVFQDETLLNVCGISDKVSDCNFYELAQFCLDDEWGTKISSLEEALEQINGEVPIFIDIINDNNGSTKIAEIIAKILDKYKGSFCIMSYDPAIVEWFKKNKPDILRGQKSTNWRKEKMASKKEAFIYTNLLYNYKTRPDFIMVDYKYRFHWSFLFLLVLFPFEKGVSVIESPNKLKWIKRLFNITVINKFALAN